MATNNIKKSINYYKIVIELDSGNMALRDMEMDIIEESISKTLKNLNIKNFDIKFY